MPCATNQAKTWLRDHPKSIPAIDIYHQQALDVLHSETAARAELADIIALDPGMSISLYHQINSRLDISKRPRYETIHGALNLLGEEAVTEFITRHITLAAFHSSPELCQTYLQLVSQGFHLMAQLDQFIEMQGMQPLNQIRSAAILHNVGELSACLFDFELYREYKNIVISGDTSTNAAQSTFGFNFNTLGKLLVEQWRLPDLVGESLDKCANVGRNAQLIQLAANISTQAELGWNHDAMKSAIETSASFLNQPVTPLQKRIKSAAVESARKFTIIGVFPAAARLILLADVEKPSKFRKMPATNSAETTQPGFRDRIESLLKSPTASQSNIIKLLIDGLYNELNFSRVVLILISKDRSALSTRLGKGLPENSPFQKLKIETASSGLFRSLMLKPQALWVNSANYKKFDTLLTDRFKATCQCENFFLMSLFVGNNAIGFIYCDRSTRSNNLDETIYSDFKTCTLLAAKALTFVTRRDSKITA